MNLTTSKAFVDKATLILALIAVLMVPLTGCDRIASESKDKVSGSNAAAGAKNRRNSAQAAAIPANILKDLPIPENSTVISYSKRGEAIITSVVSSVDTLQTTKWLLGRLEDLGYESGDNASRILEGVEYYGSRSRFDKLYIKVNLQADNKCTIDLRAYGD